MNKYLLFTILFLSAFVYAQTLLETIDLPTGTFYTQAYGMVYNDSKYWISSSSLTAGSGILNAVDETGVQVSTLNITYPGMRESQGLAFDGTNFWYVDRKTSKCDIFKVSPAGTVLDSITGAQLFGGSVYMGGGAWDGTGLWISIYYPDATAGLYKVDVSAKTIVDTIPVFGLQPQGITVKGDTLFYVMDGFQGDPENIYAVDLATEDTLFSFHVPESPGIRQNPRGLAWDGTYFWLMAEPVGASSGRQLFKYDLGGSGTPEITLSTNNIYFPNTTVGNPSDQILTIYNTGNATLTVNSININNNVFTYSGVTLPFDITAGSSQPVTVTFSPTGYNNSTGTMSISSNDPVSPTKNVSLTGQGVLPGARIGFTATSHNFGDVWIGQEGIAFWKFKTFNMGDTPLEISNMNFSLPEYTFDSPSIPFVINSTDSVELTVFFYPNAVGSYVDSLKISNGDPTNPLAKIAVLGNGVFNNYNYGYSFWQYQVPPHPNSQSAEPRVEGLKTINDLTGDGIPEVIISTENYWTMCLDGAASGNSYPLWIFTTYITNYNAGSIGANFEYGVQDAIQIADVNNDGWDDVILATGGGNEHVYVLNGTNGQIIWAYGDDVNFSLGDFEAIDARRDFTGDGIPDILAIADGNDQGTGYKRAYLFNGPDGNIIWQHFYSGPDPSFGKTIISINDLNGDSTPDAVIAYGNNGSSNLSVRALNGTNGNELWTTDMIQWEPKELLELPLPGGGSDIIATEYFGRIHRLNGTNGNDVWTYNLGASAGMIQISLIQDIDSDQIPDILVASFAGTGFNCLSSQTGNVIWSWSMAFQFGVSAIPDLDNDGVEDVIVGDQDGTIYCINGKGDSLIFSHSFPGDWIYTVNKMPSIDGNATFEIITGTKNGKVVCLSGGLEQPVIVENKNQLPDNFELLQNYPNPFNPSTTIRFTIAESGFTNLKIYDILGKEVATLVNENKQAGSYNINFGASSLASGIYFYTLKAGDFVSTKKMILLK